MYFHSIFHWIHRPIYTPQASLNALLLSVSLKPLGYLHFYRALTTSSSHFMPKRSFDQSNYTPTDPNSLLNRMAPSYPKSSGYRHPNQNKRAKPSPNHPSSNNSHSAPPPQAEPPLHDHNFITNSWTRLGGRGNPSPKWVENPKGVRRPSLSFNFQNLNTHHLPSLQTRS